MECESYVGSAIRVVVAVCDIAVFTFGMTGAVSLPAGMCMIDEVELRGEAEGLNLFGGRL